MKENSKNKRLVLIGDSITQGLGSQRVSFIPYLADDIGEEWEIINLAKTGDTVHEAYRLVAQIRNLKPQLVAILIGNVDAQIRPSRNGKIYDRLPERFRKNGGSMLLPRPFYSHGIKSIVQHGENCMRSIIRRTIYHVDGYEQWVSIEDFEEQYNKLVVELNSMDASVVCCSTVYLDEKLFPGSVDQYEQYNRVIRIIAEKNNSQYIDLFSLLLKNVSQRGWKSYYYFDHFHPNKNGCAIIAKAISERVTSMRK